MNTRLLRKVAKHIAEEPKRLSMGDWIDEKTTPTGKVFDAFSEKCREHDYAPCGTAACIGGWTQLLVFGTKPRIQGAEELLGLNEVQADRLFYNSHWPVKFDRAYKAAKTPRGKAAAAIRRIEHFIKTKGEE